LRKIPQEDLQQLQKIFDHTGATRRIETINRHSMEKAKEMGLTPEEYFQHVFNNSEKEHLNE
jgi:heterodisulfide reductase subunit C